MSMLAERKRKTKWVLNPIKKPVWTQDSSGIKFGKDLMEKMGWSAGKGLGVNEQGILEPLRTSYKNDTKGMGFHGNDNEWIENQDEFNELLKQLRGDSATETPSETSKSEMKSLEHKSKLSKARLHYQKLVRGKDLSRYSENDLACILGLNKAKKKKSNPEEAPEPVVDSKNEFETSFGVTTVKSGFIQDYFKEKYKSMLKPNYEGASVNHNENHTDLKPVQEEGKEGSEVEENTKEKKRKRKLKVETGEGVSGAGENVGEGHLDSNFNFPNGEGKEDLDVEESRKEKKRKKKLKAETISCENGVGVNDCQGNIGLTSVLSNDEGKQQLDSEESRKEKKRKKKVKAEAINSGVGENACENNMDSNVFPDEEGREKVDAEENPKEKKRKRNLKAERFSSEPGMTENFYEGLTDSKSVLSDEEKEKSEMEESTREKKKKKKLRAETASIECETVENFCDIATNKEFDFTQSDNGEKKNKRKHKASLEEESSTALETSDFSKEGEPKAKKKKKTQDSNYEVEKNGIVTVNGTVDKSVLENDITSEVEGKKIKKKKHKHKTESLEEFEMSGDFLINQSDSVEKEFKKKHKNKVADQGEKKVKEKREHNDESGFGEKEINSCESVGSVVQGESEDMSGKKNKKRKHKSAFESEVNPDETNATDRSYKDCDFTVNNEEEGLRKKKKHKSRSRDETSEDIEVGTCEPICSENSIKEVKERKKKKKNSDVDNEIGYSEGMTVQDCQTMTIANSGNSLLPENENEISGSVKEKKKKKKSEKPEIVKEDDTNFEKKETKQKTKVKDCEVQELPCSTENAETSTEMVEEVSEKTKKDKKRKDKSEKKKNEEDTSEIIQDEPEVLKKEKKSKKGEKVQQPEVEKAEDCNEENEPKKNGVAGNESNSKVKKNVDSKTKHFNESKPYKPYTRQKALNLICWADIKEFKGANLGNVLGYGFKKEYLNLNGVQS